MGICEVFWVSTTTYVQTPLPSPHVNPTKQPDLTAQCILRRSQSMPGWVRPSSDSPLDWWLKTQNHLEPIACIAPHSSPPWAVPCHFAANVTKRFRPLNRRTRHRAAPKTGHVGNEMQRRRFIPRRAQAPSMGSRCNCWHTMSTSRWYLSTHPVGTVVKLAIGPCTQKMQPTGASAN